MNDMASVIVPKSDQFNADDLLAGPRTFIIREVQIRGGQDQPVSIYFEGHEKAYRPCKSMSRCLVYAWGPDASKYKGRSLTLYCDPTVKWGGMEVGGIRISHLSHIDGALTMALTATRGSRKPFKVLPLVRQADHDLERLRMAADEAASNGTEAYLAFWKAASKEDRLKLADGHDNRKSAAAAADAQAKEIAQQAAMGDDDFPGDTQPPSPVAYLDDGKDEDRLAFDLPDAASDFVTAFCSVIDATPPEHRMKAWNANSAQLDVLRAAGCSDEAAQIEAHFHKSMKRAG